LYSDVSSSWWLPSVVYFFFFFISVDDDWLLPFRRTYWLVSNFSFVFDGRWCLELDEWSTRIPLIGRFGFFRSSLFYLLNNSLEAECLLKLVCPNLVLPFGELINSLANGLYRSLCFFNSLSCSSNWPGLGNLRKFCDVLLCIWSCFLCMW
jgi:hypothetical protein